MFALLIFLWLSAVHSLPVEKPGNRLNSYYLKRPTRQTDLEEPNFSDLIRSKEFDNESPFFANTAHDDFFKGIESSEEEGGNHLFNAFLSGSKNDTPEKDWWFGGRGSYAHKTTGSGFLFKANQTKSGTDLRADGVFRLKNQHSLFGSARFDSKPGSLSKYGGGIGYAHNPTGSEIKIGANHNALGTDLTLAGKTDFTANDKHSFRGLFSGTKDFGSGDSSIAGDFNYVHKPAGHELNFGSNFSKAGLFLNGGGKLRINDDHALSGSVAAEKVEGLWAGNGNIGYQHKPSNSDLLFGFGGGRKGKNLYAKGQTDFVVDKKHGLRATGFLNHSIGGPTDFGGTFDYVHKPSNSSFGLDVNTNMGRPWVAANGSINFKNGRKLDLGGYFSRNSGSSNAGLQLSGSF